MDVNLDPLAPVFKWISAGLAALVLALTIVVYIQHGIINKKQEVINTDTAHIQEQNDAIQTASDKFNELQKRLVAVNKTNKDLSTTYAQTLYKLNSMPIAKTCDASISELEGIAKDNATLWNSGR